MFPLSLHINECLSCWRIHWLHYYAIHLNIHSLITWIASNLEYSHNTLPWKTTLKCIHHKIRTKQKSDTSASHFKCSHFECFTVWVIHIAVTSSTNYIYSNKFVCSCFQLALYKKIIFQQWSKFVCITWLRCTLSWVFYAFIDEHNTVQVHTTVQEDDTTIQKTQWWMICVHKDEKRKHDLMWQKYTVSQCATIS